jgi:hypothetical protein
MGYVLTILVLFFRSFGTHYIRYSQDKKNGQFVVWWYIQPYVFSVVVTARLIFYNYIGEPSFSIAVLIAFGFDVITNVIYKKIHKKNTACR